MSKNNMELARNGEQVWLNYWDWEHGEDLVFELHQDGRVTRDDIEVTAEFVQNLRALAFKIRE